MRLYVCWGTFPTPRPGGHPCANAHQALREAGYEPEVVRSYGLAPLPGIFNQTRGRREVQELTGNRWVPTLVLDDGTFIDGSREIVDWALRRSEPVDGSLSLSSRIICSSPCAAARPRAITSAAASPTPSAKARMRISDMGDHLDSVCCASDPPTAPGWQAAPARNHETRCDPQVLPAEAISSPRWRGQARGEAGAPQRRQAKRTAATEVARFRLETPSRIGMLTRASARAASSLLMP
jgi:hypothetical protein